MFKFIWLISLLFFINTSQAESTNVLQNGGFETGGTVGTIIYAGDVADGWYGSRASGAPSKKLHTDEPADANRYVRFLADNAPSWSYIRHTSDTQTWKANQRYRFHMKLRLSDENGAAQTIPDTAILTIHYVAMDNTGVGTATIWKNFELVDFGPSWSEVEVALFEPDDTFVGQFIRVQIQITGLDTATMTHLDVDDVTLEEIHDVAMVPITDQMMIATNMLVPNWFTSLAEGTQRKQMQAAYYLDVPLDVTIDAAGGHDLVNTIGKAAPVYEVNLQTETVLHNGQNYKRYQLIPNYDQIHTLDDWIGPIYLSTTGADGTQATLYYHTSWVVNSIVIESEEYSVSLEYREFPEVGRPELLYSSLSWIRIAEELVWPDFLGTMDKLGFNTISANRFALKCPSNNSTCDANTESIYASPQAQNFISDAVNRGFYKLQNDSSFAGLNSTEESWVDADILEPISKAPSPCYRGDTYDAQLLLPYTLGESFKPDLLFYDIELFKNGAAAALAGDDVHCGTPFSAPELIEQGTEMAVDLNNAWGGGVAPLPLRGFYGVYQAGPTYSEIYKYESMKAADVIDLSQPQLYWKNPEQSGDILRTHMAADATSDQFIPWIDGGIVYNELVPAHVYDRAMEMYGSGAKGIAWFSFKGTEGSDFYYYAKAMQAITPV